VQNLGWVIKIFGTAEFSNTVPTDLTIEFELTDTTPIDDDAQIPAIEALDYDLVLTHETCNEDDGIATVQISGNGSANIIWSDFTTLTFIDELEPGNYWVVITDDVCGGTPDYVPFTINAYGGITIDVLSYEDIIECPSGLLMGNIEVEVTGAIAPYTVTWVPLTSDGEEGSDQHIYNAWQAGTVQCIVEDINLCADAETLAVSIGDPLTFSLDLININHIVTSQGNVICDGSIEVVVDGSTEDFIFTIDPVESTYNYGNDTFEDIEVGDFYDVTATIDLPNSVGCAVLDTYEVESDPWVHEDFDMNGDGYVNFTDYSLFLLWYGCCTGTCTGYTGQGDFDGSGCTNFNDLSAFLAVSPAEVSCP